MEEISPLFAIQAEKALQSNNPQLAIEICRRGVQFFPDYQIGYILMAEAYEMMGNTAERDKLIQEIHQKFPNAITTKAIEQKIKTEGTLLKEVEDRQISSSEFELKNEENVTEPFYSEFLTQENAPSELNENNFKEEIISLDSNIDEHQLEEIEFSNVDELIGEAQSVIEDIEETIQDLEDELIEKNDIELSEEIIMSETSSVDDEEIIQEFAEMESEISDLQDFANINQDPSSVVEFSDELIELEADESPFEKTIEELPYLQINSIDFSNVDLIPGINFLPFKFNYEEIILFSQNLTLDKYKETYEIPTMQDIQINENINTKFVKNNLETQTTNNQDIEAEQIDQENEDNSDDFIPTETLAMIYERQGKFLQAIEIYQKLMEIHPEKMEHYLNKIMLLETDGN